MEKDILLEKAQTIIEQHEEQAKWLERDYNISDKKHLAFLLEYIKTRNPVTAYRNVYGKKMATSVAAASASRLLKTVKFSIIDILNVTGHGVEAASKALDELRKTSPDKYLTHLEKLHQLDIQRVEHTGNITIKYEKDFDE